MPSVPLHVQYYFDYKPGDIYACVADIGWITGHSYVVYGPLCNGATTVLFGNNVSPLSFTGRIIIYKRALDQNVG